MGEDRANGIVDFSGIFNVGGGEEHYEREEDILPVGKDLPKPKPEPEPGVEPNPNPEPEPKPKPELQQKPAPDDGKVVRLGVDYKSLISGLAKRGVVPDMAGALFSKDDGTEVAFEDMDIPDEATFFDVMATVLEGQKESLMENKVDVASVSDFTKKLIQADKSGANVLELLKEYDRTNAPVEKLDVNEKPDQLKIIAHYVSLMGLPKDEAEDYYNSIVSKGDDFIEAKAVKYKAELDRRMDRLIAEETKRAAEKRAEDEENLKRFKKSLKTAIQTQYQLNDGMVSKAMDFLLKPSKSNPPFSEANERVKEMINDPEQAPDLIMFLMNPQEFIRQKANKKVVEEKRKTFKMITTTAKNRSGAPVDDEGKPKKGLSFEEIELDV